MSTATLPIKYVNSDEWGVISSAQRWARMSADKRNPVFIVRLGKQALGYVQCSEKRAKGISNRYGCSVEPCPRAIAG